MGHGRVIGIDIEIRPHNRKAIEAHELSSLIILIEGSSVAPEIVQRAHELITPNETTLVILDSNHTKHHVAAELEAYADLITPGSYIVATDGSMKDLSEVPRGNRDWAWDNPTAAAAAFADRHPDFELEQPAWLFNESTLTKNITHWPGAWLRRKLPTEDPS
jgi:cephalosporin hydroxylase